MKWLVSVVQSYKYNEITWSTSQSDNFGIEKLIFNSHKEWSSVYKRLDHGKFNHFCNQYNYLFSYCIFLLLMMLFDQSDIASRY